MRRSCCYAVLLAMVSACASSVPPELASAADQLRVKQALAQLFPPHSTMVHKISVRVGRRDLVLTGYLLLDREQGFQAVAVDEFGGKVFEFSRCGSDTEIRTSLPQIELGILVRGPVDDLVRVFLTTSDVPVVHRKTDGVFVATFPGQNAEMTCEFTPADVRLMSCVETNGRRHIRRIAFSYQDASHEMPSSITISNDQLHYEMKAELLRINTERSLAPCTQ